MPRSILYPSRFRWTQINYTWARANAGRSHLTSFPLSPFRLWTAAVAPNSCTQTTSTTLTTHSNPLHCTAYSTKQTLRPRFRHEGERKSGGGGHHAGRTKTETHTLHEKSKGWQANRRRRLEEEKIKKPTTATNDRFHKSTPLVCPETISFRNDALSVRSDGLDEADLDQLVEVEIHVTGCDTSQRRVENAEGLAMVKIAL